MTRIRSRWLMAAALLAGCGSTETAQNGQAATEQVPVDSPAAADTAVAQVDSTAQPMGEDTGSATGMQIPLIAIGGGGVSGTATVHGNPAGGDDATLEVGVLNAPSSESLPAHVHRGRCGTDGGVALELAPVNTVEDGSGSNTTPIKVSLLSGGELFVQVHGPAGAPILCGDIPTGG